MDKRQFNKLAKKYLEGKASSEEQQLVNDYLDSFQDTDNWNPSKMGDQARTGKDIYLKTVQEIRSRERKGKIVRLRWLSAAAVLVIFLSGIYYAVTYHDRPHVTAGAGKHGNDIPPGGTKATLVLADGSRIDLDNKGAGTLANQGSVLISKTEAGQIVYDLSQAGGEGNGQTGYNSIVTPQGGKYLIVLQDGTKVWLNSASSLRYPVAFGKGGRKVELTGEGYFEVAKDKARPFRVSASGMEVKVLGTHFNINSYSDEPYVKTTLLEGSVEVSKEERRVLLRPSEQAAVAVAAASAIRVIKDVPTDEITAWKNGMIQFRDTPLREVMRRLARWYNITVEYGEGVPDDEFTGIISEKVTMSSVLEMLEQGGGIAFRTEGRKVTVIRADN